LEVITNFRSNHIVYFYGAYFDQNPSIVYGYYSKGSLFDVLSTDINLTWVNVINISKHILQGINAMHNWKPQLIHRGLTSKSILIDENWNIFISDFGKSKFDVKINDIPNSKKKIVGNYSYIAPEIYHNRLYSTKSDIYSYGIIVWEVVNRKSKGSYETPYQDFQYDFEILIAVSTKGIRPIIPKDTPKVLRKTIKLCLDKDPSTRPSSMDLLNFLNNIFNQK